MHGKIVRRISKRLRVGRRPPVNEYTHMRSQSPVLFPFRGSSAGRLSPLHDSQRSSPLSRNSPTSSSSSISYTTGSQGWLSKCDHDGIDWVHKPYNIVCVPRSIS